VMDMKYSSQDGRVPVMTAYSPSRVMSG
jgi:hypothetical protein